MALRTSETVLCFDPEDPYEIRDRGLIYAQLGATISRFPTSTILSSSVLKTRSAK